MGGGDSSLFCTVPDPLSFFSSSDSDDDSESLDERGGDRAATIQNLIRLALNWQFEIRINNNN